MSDHVRRAFRGQGKSCAMLGSPFMGRLMPLMAERLQPTTTVARRILDWPGDVSAGGQSVPLRIAGALHGLVLDGTDAGLIAAYPPNTVDDDAVWHAVEAAFQAHEERLMAWLDQTPQTNEVRRSAALIPAIWWALNQYDMPLVLSELGASAGLNLGLDQFAITVDGDVHGPKDSPVQLAPDWLGPHPTPRDIVVAQRAAVDQNPLNPHDPTDRLRLLAYLWPDQPARRALTEGAIALAGAAPDSGDAAPWLEKRLSRSYPGHVHIVFHTIAFQYFPAETQSACRLALDASGARATHDAPLAHIALEADGDPKGAGLSVEIWPKSDAGDKRKLLARADYHGRWINWLE